MHELYQLMESYKLFRRLHCCSGNMHLHLDDDTDILAFIDEDKMRCHILSCLAALRIVQNEKDKMKGADTDDCESIKRKIFSGAISMMNNAEYDNDQNPILSAFPDDSKMYDDRKWLPMHFAIALTFNNQISEEDVHILHAANPLALHLLSGIDGPYVIGYTPIHLLCMQNRPNLSLVRYLCLRDPKAFILCDGNGKSALHMVAQYCESVEALQSVLQIDHALTKIEVNGPFIAKRTVALGLLCGRFEFPSFDDMFLCLTEVDSTVSVIYEGVVQCMQQYKDTRYQDISPGSKGDRTLILLGKLLNLNGDVASHNNSNIFHWACSCLRGELGISVLSLFLSRNSGGIKHVSTKHGYLLIHHAVMYSSLDVVKFLVKAYPESLSMVTGRGTENDDVKTLLHKAQQNQLDSVETTAIVKYLCNSCPALIHMKCDKGETPLHLILYLKSKLNIMSVKFLCNIDETVVRDKCTPSDIASSKSQRLPSQLLINYMPPMLEVSEEGDCFRLLLRLYPASAGIKDGQLKSLYNLAVSKGLSAYFLRLLLSADPTSEETQPQL